MPSSAWKTWPNLTSGAESVLDSLLHADGDSLRVLLPDSLRAELPDDLASWRNLPPKTAEALAEAVRRNLTAAQDSTLEWFSSGARLGDGRHPGRRRLDRGLHVQP